MEMGAVLETPWSEEPTPCIQMKAVSSYSQRPHPRCDTYLIQQETLSWAQAMYDPEAPRPYLPAPLARPPPPGKPSPVFCYALPQGLHIIKTVGAADVVDQHKGVRVLQAPVFRVRPLLGVEARVYSRPSSNSPSFPVTSQQHSGRTLPQARFSSPAWILSALNPPTSWASRQTTVFPTQAPTASNFQAQTPGSDMVTDCPGTGEA